MDTREPYSGTPSEAFVKYEVDEAWEATDAAGIAKWARHAHSTDASDYEAVIVDARDRYGIMPLCWWNLSAIGASFRPVSFFINAPASPRQTAPTVAWETTAENPFANIRITGGWLTEQPDAPTGDEVTWGVTATLSSLNLLRRMRTTTPIIIARPGTAGEDGTDGAGWEWIYAVTSTSSPPTAPLNSWKYDQPRGDWHDGYPGVSSTKPWGWVSKRRIVGTPSRGDDVTTGSWETPKLHEHYGIDGRAGVDGSDGEAGAGFEWVFAVTASSTAPTAPSNSWGYDRPQGNVWKDNYPGVTAAKPNGWVCRRPVVGTPALGASVPGLWGAVALHEHFGADGKDGADAISVNVTPNIIVFRQTSTGWTAGQTLIRAQWYNKSNSYLAAATCGVRYTGGANFSLTSLRRFAGATENWNLGAILNEYARATVNYSGVVAQCEIVAIPLQRVTIPTPPYHGVWVSGASYKVGDKVFLLAGTVLYSFTCTTAHTAASANKPASGVSWTTYWTRDG